MVDVYRDVVALLGRIWHEWFSARIRLAATTAGAIADRMPRLSAAERATYLEEVERLTSEGHTVLQKYADPSGHWGPEGRAWMKRLDAETLRARWLAGTDAPPQDALVDAWRDAEQLFADLGHVHELAAVRTTLAGILRATGDAAGAREVGDLAREAAPALGAQPLLDELRAVGSAPSRGDAGLGHPDRARGRDPRPRRRGPVQRRDRQAAVHQRQDRLGPRVQHPRPSSVPPAAPRPPPSPTAEACSADSLDRLSRQTPGVSRRVRHDREGYLRARTHQRPGGTT